MWLADGVCVLLGPTGLVGGLACGLLVLGWYMSSLQVHGILVGLVDNKCLIFVLVLISSLCIITLFDDGSHFDLVPEHK